MKNVSTLAAALLVAALAGGAHAEGEPTPERRVVAAYDSIPDALKALKKAVTDNKAVRALKKDIQKGKTDGRAEVVRNGGCLPGTHPSQEGENGVVCRSDKPFSVTCEIAGWKKVVDEMGERYEPVLGKCDPEGGFGGTRPGPQPAPQAP